MDATLLNRLLWCLSFRPAFIHDQHWEIKFKNCEIRVMKTKIIFHNVDSFFRSEYESMYLKLNNNKKKLQTYHQKIGGIIINRNLYGL